MNYKTTLSGQTFVFGSVKEVLAKAGEHKSGDVLAGGRRIGSGADSR